MNSRTGTVVISRGVRVTAAAVTQGALSVTISATNEVVQPPAQIAIGQAGVAQRHLFKTPRLRSRKKYDRCFYSSQV